MIKDRRDRVMEKEGCCLMVWENVQKRGIGRVLGDEGRRGLVDVCRDEEEREGGLSNLTQTGQAE